ncbi:hypothetical protein H9P43_002708 [Blastocladiella emersonii ATCC 22665]|nr:hypothetical protein H9P43_002708 [Blastocladiella emersonii ATCC 22665]
MNHSPDQPKMTLEDLPLDALENILARCAPLDVLNVSRLSRKWHTMLSNADEDLWNSLLRAHASQFAHVILARARKLQLNVSPRDLYFATVCRTQIHAWGEMAREANPRNPGHVPVVLKTPRGVSEPITQLAMGGTALYVVYGDGTLAVLGRVVDDAGEQRNRLTVIRRDVRRVVPARYGVAVLTKNGRWVRTDLWKKREEFEHWSSWAGYEEDEDDLGPASLIVGSGWEHVVTYDAASKRVVSFCYGTIFKDTFPHPGVRFVGNVESDLVVATATHVYQRSAYAADSDPWLEVFAVATSGPRESIVELNCFFRTIGPRDGRLAPRVITDDGSVHTWGAHANGANGHERGSFKEPKLMACFEQDRTKAVIHLATGGWSSAALVVPLGGYQDAVRVEAEGLVEERPTRLSQASRSKRKRIMSSLKNLFS